MRFSRLISSHFKSIIEIQVLNAVTIFIACIAFFSVYRQNAAIFPIIRIFFIGLDQFEDSVCNAYITTYIIRTFLVYRSDGIPVITDIGIVVVKFVICVYEIIRSIVGNL